MPFDEEKRNKRAGELKLLRTKFAGHEPEETGKGIDSRESSLTTSAYLEAMFDGVLVLDMTGKILFVNKTLEAITGYDRQELVGSNCLDFVPAATRENEFEAVVTILQEAFLNESTPPFTYTHVRKDGKEIPVSCTASFLRDEQGSPKAVVVVQRDESERVLRDKTLRENEERFRALFEGSLDAVFLADPESGLLLDANPSACDLVRMQHQEIVGLHYAKLIPEHLRNEAGALYAEYQLDKGPDVPVEGQVLCADGTVREVELLAQMIQVDGRPVLHGVLRDITERKRSEQALQESEAKFRSLADQSPNMIFINQRGRLAYVNRKCEETMGYTREEFYAPDFDFRCLVAQESISPVMESYRQHMDGKDVPPYEYSIVTKAGRKMEVIQTTKLIQFDGDQAILGIITDISDRKETEQALRESEERFRTLVETSPDGIGVTDLAGKVTYVSPRLVTLHDFETEQELIGKHMLDFVVPKDRDKVGDTIRETLAKGITKRVDCCLLRNDGSDFFGEGNLSLIHDENGDPKGFMGVLRDVTERKKIEAELANNQRIESLGILAGGIAHDFNNILSAISTNLSTAKMFGNLDPDVEQMLTEAETASMRAQSLTHQLLTFAKGGLPVKKTVFLQRLLKDTIDFTLRGSNVRCEHEIPTALWPIEADEGQIGQAVQNLILNADQAMPEGGVIRIVAQNDTSTKEEVPTLKESRYVRISLVDHGVGIPEKHLHKIFDPFFSTKYKGSGLGLAISHSIVTKHGGAIRVESEVGVGSTFHVYLPAASRFQAIQAEKPTERLRGKGTILLVDDEAILRRAAGQALKKMGFSVTLAREGREAVAIYKEAMDSGTPVDAVIMDLTIPGGMGGKEAVKEILNVDPQAKVIVSSGYADDPVMAEYKDYGFSGVIKKPYRIDEIGEVLLGLIKG